MFQWPPFFASGPAPVRPSKGVTTGAIETFGSVRLRFKRSSRWILDCLYIAPESLLQKRQAGRISRQHGYSNVPGLIWAQYRWQLGCGPPMVSLRSSLIFGNEVCKLGDQLGRDTGLGVDHCVGKARGKFGR